MKKLIIGVVVVGVAVGAYLMFRPSPVAAPEVSATPEVSTTLSPVASASASPSVSPTAQGSVKMFNVSGGMFYFDPKEIKVNKGDTVKIVFANKEGFHDWVIDEFNARTPRIKAGETSTIEFVASKVGAFEYYCSVGEHRAQGMWGTLIVQ